MKYDVILNLVDKTASGLKTTENNLSKVERRAKLVNRSFIGVGAALTAVTVIGAGIKSTIDKMDGLAKSARNVGITTDEGLRSFTLQRKVMEEAGIAAGDFQRSMENLQLRIRKGQQGGGKLGEVYDKLGDSILDSGGKILETSLLLEQVSKSISDGTLDITDAAALLGEKVGPKMYQVFKLMEESGLSYADAMKSVEASTSLFTFGDAAKAEIFNDSMIRLKTTLVKVFDEAIVPMLPALADMAELFAFELPAGIQSTISKVEAITGWFTDLSPATKTALKWLLDLGMFFTNFLPDMISDSIEALGLIIGVLDKMYTVGKDMIQKMIDGITSMIQPLKDKITEIGSIIPDWMYKMWDLPHAAGVFIGEAIVGGISDGAEASAEAAVSQMETLGKDLSKGLEVGFAASNATAVIVKEVADIPAAVSPSLMSGMDALEEEVAAKSLSIGDVLAAGLKAGFEGGKFNFESFKTAFLDSLADLVIQVLAQSDILNGMFKDMDTGNGGLGGLASGVGSVLGDMFAGFFADGGNIGSGKFGVVGEAGPELVKGPATVYSNADSLEMASGQGRGQPIVVEFNINAIDAQTGTEFILKNKNAVIGMVNQAMNAQGKRGLI